MLTALSAYDVDVAFAGSSGPLPREYTGRELLRVPQLLAVPAGHPLAGRQAVPIRELERETFIDLPPGFAMRTVADGVFAGVGVAILLAYAITPHQDLHAVKVREHDFRWSLTAAAAALLQLAGAHLIEPPGVERPSLRAAAAPSSCAPLPPAFPPPCWPPWRGCG
jgi:DNA-binding transcriptional LysR family regulator